MRWTSEHDVNEGFVNVVALSRVPGVETAPPADDVDLAVADALLPMPVPDSLRAFLTLSNGARVGDLEVYSAERITAETTAGRHLPQLLPSTLVIGTAGAGRALVMIAGRAEVCEVDDDWDARTVEVAADSPYELFVEQQGIPLRRRERWWALPGLADALDEVRRDLRRDVDALLDVGLASRVGDVLPSSLTGFTAVDFSLATSLIASDEYSTLLVNLRPDSPVPGCSASAQWPHACDEVADSVLMDRIRQAPVPEAIAAAGSLDDGWTMAETIRDLAYLALLAKARESLAASIGADADDHTSTGRRLADVFLTGHVPVSLSAAL